MIKKQWVMIAFTFLLVFSFVNSVSAELSLKINAHLDEMSADFRAETNSAAATGYEGFDALVPNNPSDPSSKFYSLVSGNQLGVDSWPASANPRTLNLVYQNSPSTPGTLILSWSFTDPNYDVILKDYGSDSGRTNLVQSIDLSDSTIYSTSSSGTHYFSLTVSNVVAPVTPGSGSSGGGAGGATDGVCKETKLCTEWSECQNLEQSLKLGALEFSDYSFFKASCSKSDLDDNSCGYQTRECNIIASCKNSTIPSQSQFCEYVKNPSCNDKVKNCHDGKCEILIDCGGPCGACGSCSNGIKDKGESGIDCGGVCADQCTKVPLKDIISNSNLLFYVYIAILAALMGIFIALIVHLVKIIQRVRDDSLRWYKL